jgi:uncharacterized membrane protein
MPKKRPVKTRKIVSNATLPLDTALTSCAALNVRRFMLIDMLRGMAIGCMVIYHFCFDLNYFRLTAFDFNHSLGWLAARDAIVTLFLMLVGVSLHLSTVHGVKYRPYLKRLWLLLMCASLVSVASYQMFPESGIFFGILHFIAFASVLGLLFSRITSPALILLCGVSWIVAGMALQHPWFDQPWANWIGLMTHKPITEDYVPLFPWFGVVLVGLFAGHTMTRYGVTNSTALTRIEAYAGNRKLLTLAGRHSLLIYMLHQPVLMCVAYFVKQHIRSSELLW